MQFPVLAAMYSCVTSSRGIFWHRRRTNSRRSSSEGRVSFITRSKREGRSLSALSKVSRQFVVATVTTSRCSSTPSMTLSRESSAGPPLVTELHPVLPDEVYVLDEDDAWAQVLR